MIPQQLEDTTALVLVACGENDETWPYATGHIIILDEHTEPWGIKVTQVQVKQVDLPQDMQRAIAAQAEAERERRAKIIAATGEFQAATKLAEAAAVLSREPAAITLRYLQTLIEIGVEKNTTIVFPLPIDILAGLAKLATKKLD